MDIKMPLLVVGNLFPAPGEEDTCVRYYYPQAPGYARGHLEQVRQPIQGALGILVLHGVDVADAAEELKAWIDAEVERLTQ